ncbi:MAG: universal stress protein [Akkermansiaceae bacterium]|nr:universal stress protein [Verrucomicrobiales bacterium]
MKEILFFLPTYPDAPSEQAMNSVGFLAQTAGAKLTALIPQLSDDASTWPKVMGAFPLNFPQLMQESVRSSERNAQLLSEAMTKVSSEYSVALDLRKTLTVLYASPQSLVDLARLHDLTVLPIPETDSFDRKYLQAVLFDSGRPTLLLPSGRGCKQLRALKTIVVAWDFSREAARAVSDALPLLKLAKEVRVLTVLGEKHMPTTSKVGDLEKYLNSHSVKFVLEETKLKGHTIGECLGSYVSNANADMLVMGAYGHSRLREFALGGATRALIADAAVPVFLSH